MVQNVKKLSVLVVCQEGSLPALAPERAPNRGEGLWRPVQDVSETLQSLGHQVQILGIDDELAPLRRAILRQKPDVVFNLVEAFMGIGAYDQHVVSFLELLRVPYTGSGPRGLTLSRDKALSKKILSYHRIKIPQFQTFALGRRPKRRKGLEFPLIVKSLVEDASYGISLASLVHNDEKLNERVTFVHERVGTDAIAERFIEGRELYSAVLGNDRRTVFPTWELRMTERGSEEPLIATEKAKFDLAYQDRKGVIHTSAALPAELERKIMQLSRRVCRILGVDGYCRVDYRLDHEGNVYFIEANPNPDIMAEAEFANSAEFTGISYSALLERILRLGLSRHPAPSIVPPGE